MKPKTITRRKVFRGWIHPSTIPQCGHKPFDRSIEFVKFKRDPWQTRCKITVEWQEVREK